MSLGGPCAVWEEVAHRYGEGITWLGDGGVVEACLLRFQRVRLGLDGRPFSHSLAHVCSLRPSDNKNALVSLLQTPICSLPRPLFCWVSL